MYCKYCGKQIDDNSSFCSGCGKSIDSKINTTELEDNYTDYHNKPYRNRKNYNGYFWGLFAISSLSLLIPFIPLLKYNSSGTIGKFITQKLNFDYDQNISLIELFNALLNYKTSNTKALPITGVSILILFLFAIIYAIAAYFLSSALNIFLKEGTTKRYNRNKIFKRFFYIPSEILVDFFLIYLFAVYSGKMIIEKESFTKADSESMLNISYVVLGIIVVLFSVVETMAGYIIKNDKRKNK